MARFDDVFKEYNCEICNKVFIPRPNWLYKITNKKGNVQYYCSYTCWRKDGGDSGKPTHGI